MIILSLYLPFISTAITILTHDIYAGAADVSATVAKACVGRADCALNVSAAALGVKDPAPGLTKALTVQWTCAADDTRAGGRLFTQHV